MKYGPVTQIPYAKDPGDMDEILDLVSAYGSASYADGYHSYRSDREEISVSGDAQKALLEAISKLIATPTEAPAITVEAEPADYSLLRAVYEEARRVLRFNGIDKARCEKALDDLEGAIEIVKQFDGGTYEPEPAHPKPAAQSEPAPKVASGVGMGVLIALTKEKNKLSTALGIACGYLTDEQVAEVAAAMPSDSAAPPAMNGITDDQILKLAYAFLGDNGPQNSRVVNFARALLATTPPPATQVGSEPHALFTARCGQDVYTLAQVSAIEVEAVLRGRAEGKAT